MLRDFFRTIRSYTFGEKLLSILFLGIFVFSSWGFFHSSAGFGRTGTYDEGAVGRILVLNPLFTNFNELDRDAAALIFSGLMKYDVQTGKMAEDMAKMKLSEDQLTYTFTMKDGVYFHNGSPVTADDIYFTYHDVIQSEDFSNAVLKANFEGVTITKVDTKTIQFHINEPNSFFLTNLTVGILPKKNYEKVPVSELMMHEINKNPIGSGPYKVSDPYTFNNRGDGKLTLVRFDQYYGGPARIQTIVLHTYSSFDRLYSSIGDLDAVAKISGDAVNKLKNSSLVLHPYELPQYKAAFFNMSRPFMKDRNVRLALEKSVNKTDLLKSLPNTVAVDTPFMDLRQDQWIYQSDVTEAQGALYDGGYRYDAKKTVRKSKKGNPLEIKLVYFTKGDKSHGDDEDAITAAFLKKSWTAIGFSVQIETHDAGERSTVVGARDYDVLLAGESLGYDLDTYFFWHSSQATETGSNLSNYKNFSADGLIEDIRNSVDEDRKTKRLNQLAKTVSNDIPAVFLYRPVYFYATDEKFKGYQLDHLAFPADRFSAIQLWQ